MRLVTDSLQQLRFDDLAIGSSHRHHRLMVGPVRSERSQDRAGQCGHEKDGSEEARHPTDDHRQA